MILYCCYVVVMSVCLCSGCVIADTTKFRVRKNLKMPTTDVDKSIRTDDSSKCLMLCKLETAFQCETASWGEGMCLLSNTEMIHVLYDDTMEINDEWTTVCRKVYPVFIAEGSSGRYTLNLDQGKARCIELDSKIASRQALLDSRALGFEMCLCGWLADVTMGLVLQQRDPECWYLYSDGIIPGCSENFALADVYCEA